MQIPLQSNYREILQPILGNASPHIRNSFSLYTYNLPIYIYSAKSLKFVVYSQIKSKPTLKNLSLLMKIGNILVGKFSKCFLLFEETKQILKNHAL